MMGDFAHPLHFKNLAARVVVTKLILVLIYFKSMMKTVLKLLSIKNLGHVAVM